VQHLVLGCVHRELPKDDLAHRQTHGKQSL
jgi:hypothetical protein